MTREQFVEHWRHEFFGMVCESLRADAKGGDLGMRMTAIEGKILKHLNQMYAQLTINEPATNGLVKK